MAVRKGDRDQGKLQCLEASKELIKYTYDRVKDNEIFPKSQRWLMAKTMKIGSDKMGKQRRRIRKLLEKELRGEVAPGTTYNSLVAWKANANRGNSYYQQKRMTEYYYAEKARVLNDNDQRKTPEAGE